MLASCALDVKLHDWDTGDHYTTITGGDAKNRGFVDMDWCNEGKYLVTVPCNGKAQVTNIGQSFSASQVFLKEPVEIFGVRCVSYSKLHNQHLAVGTETGEVFLYNTGTKEVLQTFQNVPGTVNSIHFGADDTFMAAACENGQIFLYGPGPDVRSTFYVPSSTTVTSLKTHSRIPYLLAGGSERGVVSIWDINCGNCILQSTDHKSFIFDMAFSVNDDSFCTVGSDQKINIYDLRTSECVHNKQFDGALTALTYCPNGCDIAVGTGMGQIICLDMRYLHSCKSGLRAHSCPIRKISFDTENMAVQCSVVKDTSRTSLDMDVFDDELRPSGESEGKASGSGDYSMLKKTYRCGRNLYNSSDKYSMDTSRCHIHLNNPDRTTFHIIDENSLNVLRDDVMKATKEIVSNLVETMNNEFLKMRMGVSREFCTMELMHKRRWQEFNMVLLKVAELEDRDLSEVNIKDPSILSHVKAKISSGHLLHNNSSKSMK